EARSPLVRKGWPQQVCWDGTSKARPRWRRRSALASTARASKCSARQGTNSAMRSAMRALGQRARGEVIREERDAEVGDDRHEQRAGVERDEREDRARDERAEGLADVAIEVHEDIGHE